MNPQLIEAAAALAHVLTLENEALRALDLPRAGSFVSEKTNALQAITEAEKAGNSSILSPGQRTRAQAIASQLRTLGEENRRLLERALVVQRRVIGIVTRAVPRAAAERTPRYGSNGALSGLRRPPPVALLARA
jgi:hypothetical protein